MRPPKAGALIATGAVLGLAGCGKPALGSRVDYEIFELPRPIESKAGSCIPKGLLLYSDARLLKWASGTNLEVITWWPDRTDCTGLWNPVCPRVTARMTAINPGVWSVQQEYPGTAAVAVIHMSAIGAGTGGFEVSVDGQAFSPAFVLTVDDPVDIWFERATGPAYGDVIPGRISKLDIPVGGDSTIAVTLRNSAGEHLCGPVQANVAIDGRAFSLDPLTEVGLVNLPYHIVAGDAPGVGSIQFSVGGLKASLPITVGP